MTTDREQRIREKAYEIWERQGRPEGGHEEHWHQAEREIAEEGRGAATPESGGEAAEASEEVAKPKRRSARGGQSSAQDASPSTPAEAAATEREVEAGAPKKARNSGR